MRSLWMMMYKVWVASIPLFVLLNVLSSILSFMSWKAFRMEFVGYSVCIYYLSTLFLARQFEWVSSSRRLLKSLTKACDSLYSNSQLPLLSNHRHSAYRRLLSSIHSKDNFLG